MEVLTLKGLLTYYVLFFAANPALVSVTKGAFPPRVRNLRAFESALNAGSHVRPGEGSDPLVVESQLYTAGALVSFYAYTIGKLSNHKAR